MEEDTFFKRIARGFKILVEKIKNGYNKLSEFVNNVKKEQKDVESGSAKDFMPEEISRNSDDYQFSTDLSKIGI